MYERDDIAQLSAHTCQDGSDVLEDFSDLDAHIASPDDLTGLIEWYLAFQVNNLSIALNDGY